MEDFKKFSLLKHHETIATDNTMEQKHTPGPWNVVESNFYGKNYIVEDSKGNTLAAFSDKSTAELVARAPELLEQLKQLKEEKAALTKEKEVLKQQHDFNCEYKTLEIVRLTEQVEKLKAELEKTTELSLEMCKENYNAGMMCERILIKEELSRLREERKESRKAMQKFINKVESNRARSVETYNDFKTIFSKFPEVPNE